MIRIRRSRIAIALTALGVGLIPAVAHSARANTPPTTVTTPETEDAASDTTVPEAPPTTSEFGTETEIEIALDDQGNIVPAHP